MHFLQQMQKRVFAIFQKVNVLFQLFDFIVQIDGQFFGGIQLQNRSCSLKGDLVQGPEHIFQGDQQLRAVFFM